MKKLFFSCILILSASSALAVIDLPHNLSKSDREESLRILGFGTSNKILSDPFPLGGYSGVEFGVAVSDIQTDELKNLGNKLSEGQSDVAYTSFSLGKGVYNNVDVALNITPYLQSVQLSQFGAQLRWSFYQAETLPLSFSSVFNVNSSNVGNQVSLRTFNADLLGAFDVNRVALFSGVGAVSSAGDFLGGNRGVTDSGYQETEHVSSFHFLLGVSVRLTDFFLCGEIDHYQDTVYSAKFGMRL